MSEFRLTKIRQSMRSSPQSHHGGFIEGQICVEVGMPQCRCGMHNDFRDLSSSSRLSSIVKSSSDLIKREVDAVMRGREMQSLLRTTRAIQSQYRIQSQAITRTETQVTSPRSCVKRRVLTDNVSR